MLMRPVSLQSTQCSLYISTGRPNSHEGQPKIQNLETDQLDLVSISIACALPAFDTVVRAFPVMPNVVFAICKPFLTTSQDTHANAIHPARGTNTAFLQYPQETWKHHASKLDTIYLYDAPLEKLVTIIDCWTSIAETYLVFIFLTECRRNTFNLNS